VEHLLLHALAAAGAVTDYVVTHVLPGQADRAWVTRIGASVRLLAGAPAGAGTLKADGTLPAADVVGPWLADRFGGVPCPELADLSERRVSGRCVRFPGQRLVQGEMTAGAIVRSTGIDRVTGTGVQVDALDVVDTGGYLRPCFDGGELVLLVGPAAGGRLVPLETAIRHECCAGVHG